MPTGCSRVSIVARRLGAAITLLLSSFTFAQGQVLMDFPQAELEEERAISSASHQVMLSPIREVGPELRAERSQRLAVEGSARLLEIAPGITRQDAWRWYLEQLQTRNASILFQCSGRECGRSNVWANQVFGQAMLYGRDARQDYLVAGFEEREGQRWLVVLYTVTRGNQREYVWLEQLKLADDAVLGGIGKPSRLAGPLIVPWSGGVSVRLDWDGEARRILETMTADPDSQVVIAAFSGLEPDETLEAAIERAERAAITMSRLLARSGLSSSRHIIRAVGPMVRFTTPERPENRIELLVIAPPGEVKGDG